MGSSKKTKRIKLLFLIYLSVILITLFPQYTRTVSGIVIGDYWVCNFEDWAIGTKYIDEYVEGNHWMNLSFWYGYTQTASVQWDRGDLTNKCYQVYNSNDDDGADFSWSNLTFDFPTWEIGFDYKISSYPSHEQLTFYSGPTYICKIWVGCYGGETRDRIILYVGDTGADYNKLDWDNTGGVHVSAYFFAVNNTVGFQMYNLSTPTDQYGYYEEVTNFGYIDFVGIEQVAGHDWYKYCNIDNIIFNSADTPDVQWGWELDLPSYGYVMEDSTGNLEHDFTNSEYFIDESDYTNFPSGYFIDQVALAIDIDSDISNTDFWLRIGDDFLEEETTIYTVPSHNRYVLVWESMQLLRVNTTVNCEFKFVNTHTGELVYVLYANADIDEDGDIEFKTSDDVAYFNGVYDGKQTVNRDLIYQVWYGWGLASGDITVNVYNESDPTVGIPMWNITIYNKVSKFIYVNLTNTTNPTVINASEYGLGPRIIEINAEGYYDRSYYVNVENAVNYTLDAYLCPIVGSQIYCLQVVKEPNEYGTQEPIYDARIKITRYIAGYGLINVTEVFTGYNGIAYVSLIIGKTYTFNISKEGYFTEYQTLTTTPYDECYTFTLKSDQEPPEYTNETVYHECISYTGYISGTNIYMHYIDYCGGTTDATFVVLEINQSTGNSSAIYWWNNTVFDDFEFDFPINLSNDYKIDLYLNHSIFGYVFDFRYIFHESQNITSRSDFDNKFNNGLFNNPLGWSACFGIIVLLAGLFSFGQDNAGVSLIITGFIMLGINSLGITVLGVGICIVIIVLGILVQARRERRKS